MSSKLLPFSDDMGLQVQLRNKATVFSVEELIISTPKEGQTSSFQSEVHDNCFFDIHGTVHYKFILNGETVNHHFYSDILQSLHEDV